MTSVKRSISLTEELAQALQRLAEERGEDLSRTVEILLRESRYVEDAITRLREGPPRVPRQAPGDTLKLKKGRDPEKLRMLIRVARHQWQEKLRSGQVKPLGPV